MARVGGAVRSGAALARRGRGAGPRRECDSSRRCSSPACARTGSTAPSSPSACLCSRRDQEPAVFDEDGGVIRVRATIDALTGALRERIVFDEVLSVRATSPAPSRYAPAVGPPSTTALSCAPAGGRRRSRGGPDLPLPLRQAAHRPSHLRRARRASGAAGVPARFERRVRRRRRRGGYGDPLPGNAAFAVGLDDTPLHDDGSLIDAGGLTDDRRAHEPRTSPARYPACTRNRSTSATAGSPSCPGAPTASPCGRSAGC